MAAAIDVGGAEGVEVQTTLIQVGNGEHPIGVMGRHVIVGLLRASRPDGWDFVERLLLAAQRQEGLRQVILEAIDESHPTAFDRMLALIADHNLLRFAATVRAVGTWFGLLGDVTEIPKIADRVQQLRQFRADSSACQQAILNGDPWSTYVAMCSAAMIDVHMPLGLAPSVLARPDRDVRAAAVRFLIATGLRSSNVHLSNALGDQDLVVAALAAGGMSAGLAPPDVFERLQALAGRLPAKARNVEGVGVETTAVKVSRQLVAAVMLNNIGSRPLSVMLPWLGDMDVHGRYRFATELGKKPRQLTPELRQALMTLVGDRSAQVRQAAVKGVSQMHVGAEQISALEELLTRNASDLRRAVIGLLAKQDPRAAVASAERLRAGNPSQRAAAIALLGALGTTPEAKEAAQRFSAGRVRDDEQELLATVTGEAPPVDAGLGLYDPARRAATFWPKLVKAPIGGDVARHIVSALDDVAQAHRDDQFVLSTWQGSREVLLADVTFLPSPFLQRQRPPGDDSAEEGSGLILADVFQEWWANRPAQLRNGPLDSLYAYAATGTASNPPRVGFIPNIEMNRWWFDIQAIQVGGTIGVLRHFTVVRHVLSRLLVEEATADTVEVCLLGAEDAVARVPYDLIERTPTGETTRIINVGGPRSPGYDWRNQFAAASWLQVLSGLLPRRPDLYTRERIRRWFNLLRLIEEPIPGARRREVPQKPLLAAYEDGIATDDDIYGSMFNGRLLNEFTRRRRDNLELQHPGVIVLADRLRDRIVETERTRGDLATPASRLAYKVQSVSGAEIALELLARMGRAARKRGHVAGNEGREAVYSHLLRVSYPAPTDTAESLAKLAAKLKILDGGLVELAVFAPQWSNLIEEALEWDGLADAVWWFHAHSKDDNWSVSLEVRQAWTAQTAERTMLSASDRVAGATDVDWFNRSHTRLGAKRWKTVFDAAKLASGGNGHRRAQLFSEAMLGETDEAELIDRITSKRNQDSVRALGLLPLPSNKTQSQTAVANRYSVLREFERGSRKFGSQRQASEKTAVRIGIENLARTAGYPDPQRFVWATEAAESADLAEGPATVTIGDVVATLAVDEEGVANFTVSRSGKTLAAVPAALRKNPDIAALRDRKTALVRQASRVRTTLEAAMIRQERFTAQDLVALEAHPIVAPMLRLLLFVDDTGSIVQPGSKKSKPKGALRLAHPIDLVGSGQWISAQEKLFTEEQRQPFKQVFRELYVLTDAERSTSPVSHRYEGHQVQPRQAQALFTRRGWINDREAGDVSRVFHEYDLVARVSFQDGFGTPAEVELPTITTLGFTRRNTYIAEPLETVPPIVFSETMRDLDLVVSVAHAGGVDPEASASTVEMRAALVRQTARALKLDNVREVGSHVVIEGALGEYSVHLGSAVVHRRPGGAVCIIPVNSQRRGRLFLPFADDDPKTAEVISKVLLLANDRQIKDPTILEQLRS